jgi:transcriptional regulator with XRE-family HTH domain
MAGVLGVSRSTVCQWERGNRVQDASRVLAYGRLLKRLTAQAA